MRRYFGSGLTSSAETWEGDVGAAVLSGVGIVLAFRFLFGDPWPVAIGGGIVVAAATMLFGVWQRRRRARRETG